jgi:hypothetical protein
MAYDEASSICLTLCGGSRRVVVKHVDIGAASFCDAEHRERTRMSYACECAFYTQLAGGLPPRCPVPVVHHVHEDAGIFTIVMDDASDASPPTSATPPADAAPPIAAAGGAAAAAASMGMSPAEAEGAVEWLASFHAHFWRGLPDSPTLPDGDLWRRGGRALGGAVPRIGWCMNLSGVVQ